MQVLTPLIKGWLAPHTRQLQVSALRLPCIDKIPYTGRKSWVIGHKQRIAGRKLCTTCIACSTHFLYAHHILSGCEEDAALTMPMSMDNIRTSTHQRFHKRVTDLCPDSWNITSSSAMDFWGEKTVGRLNAASGIFSRMEVCGILHQLLAEQQFGGDTIQTGKAYICR